MITNFIKKLDYKYIASGFFSLSISEFVGIGMAFLSSIFVANLLDKETYGNYQFVLTIFSFLTIFTLQGLNKQIIQTYVKTKKSILLQVTIRYSKYALLATAVGFVIGGYFLYRDNGALGWSIIIISTFLPILKGLTHYDSLLLARKNFKAKAVTNSIRSIFPPLVIIVGIVNGISLLGLVFIYCISQTITLGLLYAYTIALDKQSYIQDTESSAIFHLSVNYSVSSLVKMADKLIVFSLLGAANLAVYLFALLPVGEMLRLQSILKTLVLPKFSTYSFEEVRGKAIQKTFIVFAFFLLIAIAYVVVAPSIFRFFFPAYIDSILYTQILSLLLPFSSFFIMNEMLNLFNQTKSLYQINLISALFSLLLLFFLSYFYGVLGAVIGRASSVILKFFLLLFVTMKNPNK